MMRLRYFLMSKLIVRRSAAPRWTTFTERRQLADDLTEPGDTATAALVRQATDCFST